MHGNRVDIPDGDPTPNGVRSNWDFTSGRPLVDRFPTLSSVLDSSELKKTILSDFHEKLYSGHLGYHTKLNAVKKVLLLAKSEEGCGRVCG